MTDRYETRFGVRDLKFDAAKGFFLNGKSLKIQGTCNHQDHAGVGAALPDRLQSFRLAVLHEMGCNAIRTSHNMPTPELLDACDELGMLVLDETRMLSSNPEGLAQFEMWFGATAITRACSSGPWATRRASPPRRPGCAS